MKKKISDWRRKKLVDEFEFEKLFIWWHSLMRKNSSFLRNLRFEKISALVAPRPGLEDLTNYIYN